MTTDHPVTAAAVALPPERRRRPFVVDLVPAPGDWPCSISTSPLLLACDHHTQPAATVLEAIALALSDHPGAHVLGVREPGA